MKSLCRTITLITLLVKCQAIIDGVDNIDLPIIEELPSEHYHRTEENMQPLDWKKEPNSGVFSTEFLNRLINGYYIGKRDKSSGTNSFPTSDSGFHGDVFTDGFGTFHPVKRLPQSVKSKGLYDWDCAAGQRVKGSDRTFRNCFPEMTEKELNYATKNAASDHENNVARLSKLPLLLKYLYTFQTTNKRDPVYMEGFKRIAGLRLRDPSIYKKAPNRHVGVFNGDAFHSNLGTFDTLRK